MCIPCTYVYMYKLHVHVHYECHVAYIYHIYYVYTINDMYMFYTHVLHNIPTLISTCTCTMLICSNVHVLY